MHQVNWKDGQLLLPEHFELSEATHQLYATKRAQLQGSPSYGVADIQIDQSMLDIGVIQFNTLKAISVNGQYFNYDQNLDVSQLNLSEIIGVKEAIYIHIQSSETKEVQINGQNLEVKHYQGNLSSEPYNNNCLVSFPLFIASLSPSGKWSLRAHERTPILSFMNSHFWGNYKKHIKSVVLCVEKQIKDDLLNSISPAKYVMAQDVRINSYRLENCIATIEQCGISLPNVVFKDIYNLYLTYAMYIDHEPVINLVYKHDNGCGCLNELIDRLELITKYEVKQQSLIPFVKGKRYYKLENIPLAILSSTRVYILLQKKDKTGLDMLNTKISALERLSMIQQKALPGIKVVEECSGNFSHLFDTNTTMYKIEVGQEWDYAIKYASLTLSHNNIMESIEIFIYSPDYTISE